MGKYITFFLISLFSFASLLAFEEDQATAGWRNVNLERDVGAPAKTLWRADFAQGLSGFTVERRDGAEGTVTCVDTAWGKALKVVKTNDSGLIVIKAAAPFKVADGTKLQASAAVIGEGNDPDYSIGTMRLLGKSPRMDYFGALDGRGPGGPKMNYLVNTAPGMRERKLCRYLANEANGTDITPTIVVGGYRSDSTWTDWCVENLADAEARWNEHVKAVASKDHSSDMMNAADYAAFLAADVDHTAKVEVRAGRPVLLVDGVERPPVFFKGISQLSQSGGKNLYCGNRMAAAGMDIQVVNVRLGDCPQRKGHWRKGDVFDAAGAAEQIAASMRMAPKGFFILSIGIDAYPEFCDEHPDETWLSPGGTPVYGNYVHAPAFSDPSKIDMKTHWKWPSYSSLVMREAVTRHVGELVDELKRRGISKRLVGVHVCGYHDGQLATRSPDHSKPAAAGFRRWQKERFGCVRWPEPPAGYDPKKRFLKPGEDDHVIEYFRYQKQVPMDIIETVATAFKSRIGKPTVAVRWCMSAFEGTFNGAMDITRFADSPVIDMIAPQANYERRTPGYAIGSRMPQKSFYDHGKLMICEFDFRTYGAVHYGETELRVTWASQARDAEMWRTIYRKVAGQQLSLRQGWWLFDMGGGWFEPEPIATDVSGVLATVKNLLAAPHPALDPAEVAVVIDEEGETLLNMSANYYNLDVETDFGRQMQVLANAGVPYQTLLAEDLLRDPSRGEKYRLLVFAGMFDIEARRERMLKALARDGRTLVFLYATGMCGGFEKTGFTRVWDDESFHGTRAEAGFDCNMNSLFVDGIALRYLGSVPPRDRLWTPPRHSLKAAPEIRVTARHVRGGQIAAAERQMPGWKSVAFAEAGMLSPQYFNRLAREAGAYVPVDRAGLEVDVNGDFLSLHCTVPGRYDFKLPRKCRVTNLKTGVELGRCESLPLDLTAGETRWYALGD